MADERLDDHRRELIQGLCLEAGRIMEDTSANLALSLPSELEQIRDRVDHIAVAADRIAALAQAAAVLVR